MSAQGNLNQSQQNFKRHSSERNFTMPSAVNKKMLSKSLSEPAVTMDEAVTFRGQ